MLVQQILKDKGSTTVHTVSADSSVSEAATRLSDNRIGALIVVNEDGGDGKSVVGVLSERDIVRNLGQRGPECLKDSVGDMMTRDLVCASRQDTDERVLQRMTEGHFRHMPVLDDGELIGVITLGDVVKARLSELAMENESMQGMIMGR